MSLRRARHIALLVAVASTVLPVAAQERQVPTTSKLAENRAAAVVTPPAGYVIGADDVLGVSFWRDKDLSVESVLVRPDGNITLPLLNDVRAAGLTPDQLRTDIQQAAAKYIESPNATVVVREIRSRKVYITGNVSKPASYPLSGPLNVMQLISLAGGLQEYADSEHIVIMRQSAGRSQSLKFNYKNVIKQKDTEQNVVLQAGDTVVVP